MERKTEKGIYLETKLLFDPSGIDKQKACFEMVEVYKKNGKTKLDYHNLNDKNFSLAFSNNKTVLDALGKFTDENIQKLKAEIEQGYASGKGVEKDKYIEGAWLRAIQLLFERLLPFMGQFSWYHRKIVNANKFQISGVSFSSYRPQLVFDLTKKKGRFGVEVSLNINGTVYPMEIFQQYHFWLESKQEFFLLKGKDYRTLLWLFSPEVRKNFHDANAFKQQVVATLEADYQVNRMGIFPVKKVEVVPTTQILLSELSGSFLMLTPQFNYDGFIIEGAFKPIYTIAKAGELYEISRNQDAEQSLMNFVEGLHPNFPKQKNGYYYVSFADAKKKNWFLKVYHQLLESDIAIVGMDMLNHFRYSAHQANTEMKVLEDINVERLRLYFSLHFGEEEIGLASLQKMLQSGQRAVLLKNGDLGILPDEWLNSYAPLVKHGKIGQKNELFVAKWMVIKTNNQDDNYAATQQLKTVISKTWWNKWESWQQTDEPLYVLPTIVNAQLRPYQQKGFEWMVLLSEVNAGCCLADDMGLGKTLQTISFIAHVYQQNPGQQCLVVCPASLVYNWQQEFNKFTPILHTRVFNSGVKSAEEEQESIPDVIIASYGQLRSNVDYFKEKQFGIVVVDESHNIKNPNALTTLAVHQINASHKVALSGTPVMNSTFDLYGQLGFLLPGMFGTQDFFRKEYADPIEKERDEVKINALQKLTAPFILRRTKDQVATDLPEKVQSILWCNMKPIQQAAYDLVKSKVRNSVFFDIQQNGLAGGKLSVINGMLKLRQICNATSLVKDEDISINSSIKTEVLLAELSQLISDHKVLVFSQFTSMLDILGEALDTEGMAYLRLDGTTPQKDRQELVNLFQQEDSDERIFLISLKAGNAGLTLTAADYVFLFDPWWNTAVQQQAIDRTHRIGQTRPVFAYQMICKGTIEEKIIQLQERKQTLSNELIHGDDGFVKSLTEDDISFLFS